MSVQSVSASPAHSSQAARIRLLIASSIGTIVEWYDFAVFAVCAALVFNTAFFPATDPFAGLLAALGAQAVGFVARPLGGWFFGALGDRLQAFSIPSQFVLMLPYLAAIIGLAVARWRAHVRSRPAKLNARRG